MASSPSPSPTPGPILPEVLHGNPLVIIIIIVVVLFIYGIAKTFMKEAR